jgi:hypothetical protein
MKTEYLDRIRCAGLRNRVTGASEAASWIKDGMTVGMSGFTRAGDVKVVPAALAERARHEKLKISLLTGASLGCDTDKLLTEAGALARRMPFQSDPSLRAAINRGEVMYIDQHLSETVELLRTRQIKPVDVAIIEAVAITSTGAIIPTTSVGNSASFAMLADKVIVEINLVTGPGRPARPGAARARRCHHRELRGRALPADAARLRGRGQATRRAYSARAGKGVFMAHPVPRKRDHAAGRGLTARGAAARQNMHSQC